MPLPKPWCLPPHRVLTDDEAAVLYERATEFADLQKNGLDKMVDANIRRNRMTDVRLALYDKDGYEVTGADIHVEQVSHEFKFGCNAFLADQFDSAEKNAEYERIFKDLFNQAVVPFYWMDDEPERGKWRFEKDSPYIYRRPPAEQMLDFCERTNCEPKGHNLVWPSNIGLPKWFDELTVRERGIEIEKRIRLLAEKYADKIPVWDVTNELVGTYARAKLLPNNFEVRAWELANELFYNDHLIINDFQGFFNQHYMERMSSAYMQAKNLIDRGLRVDGIGIQCHLFHNEDMLCDDEPMKFTADHMINMINCYSALGTDIHLSEITIPSYDGREKYLELQNMITENMYKLWFSMESVKSIVWWNLVDNTAIPVAPGASFDENYFGGGLLLSDFTKKPSYNTLERLINREWHTSADVHTSEKGFAAFCGFNGDYELTIKKGGDAVKKKITVTKSNPLIQIILD